MTHIRKTKLTRYIKRLEAKKAVYLNNPPKLELINEIISEIKHEFNIKEETECSQTKQSYT